MSRGGVIMYVSHESAMNITVVPHRFMQDAQSPVAHLGAAVLPASQP